jgi:nicotinamide-nucleotide amidase
MTLASLSRRVGKALEKRKQFLVTAESCTGGWVAQAVTSVAGASRWFERGYVAYSNAAKHELLGVKLQILRRHGSVSEATAREMARGALRRGRGSVALAITGVAGPAGGTPQKPVGTVCFAWARGRKLRSETRRFAGNRRQVRRKSVIHALQGVLKWL